MTNEMIADFVIAEHPPSANWPRERLLEWIDWFRRDGRCAVLSKKDSIVGVAFARLLSDSQKPENHYDTDPTSRTAYIDLVVGESRLLRPMLAMLRRRFPTVRRLRFAREKRGGKTRTYNLDRFERALDG